MIAGDGCQLHRGQNFMCCDETLVSFAEAALNKRNLGSRNFRLEEE